MLKALAGIALAGIASAFIFWKCYFLRNPERIIPSGRLMVSPADGKVVEIIPFRKKHQAVKKGRMGHINTMTSEVAESGWLVSIFMSPFDVHYNRAPVAGRVVSTTHVPGKFNVASSPKALIENEKCELLLENKSIGKIKVIQIAGAMARRIECHVNEGDELKKGQRFGLINLGSQCTIILPKKVKLAVKVGDKLQAGSSIIGRY